jgi:hypothetical protein
MLKIDGHDNAILGPAFMWNNNQLVQTLVYDAEMIRENLMNDGMTAEEAREFIEFNIEGAYLGDGTPILVWTQDEWSDWIDE